MSLDIHPKLPSWQLSLSVGDIVAFRFPPACGIASAVNPALVVEVTTIAGTRVVTLACGAPVRRTKGHDDIVVGTPGDLAAAGLAAPTRFVTGKRITVSLPSESIVVPRSARSPVVGRLPSKLVPALEEARARMWGAAFTSAPRRSVRRRPRVRGEDFEVVERRRRRRRCSETPRRRAQQAAR